MKRYKAVEVLLSKLKENDVIIFSGNELCKEAFKYDRDSNFYVTEANGLASSLALGIAMGTDKRVFIFCGEGEFLREMGSAAQMAVSRCENVFYVIFDNDGYQSAGGHPNIFNEFGHTKGMLFNMGFVVHDFSNYFRDKNSIKSMTRFIENIKGPMVILIKVEKGFNYRLKDISFSKQELQNRISEFIQNRELGSSLFNPTYDLNTNEGVR